MYLFIKQYSRKLITGVFLFHYVFCVGLNVILVEKAFGEDKCQDILILDTTVTAKDQEFINVFQELLERDTGTIDSGSQSSGETTDVTGSFEGIGLGFFQSESSTQNYWKEFREYYKYNKNILKNERVSEFVRNSYLPRFVVDAWSDCMKTNKEDVLPGFEVKMEGDVTDNFTLEIKFNPPIVPANLPKATLIDIPATVSVDQKGSALEVNQPIEVGKTHILQFSRISWYTPEVMFFEFEIDGRKYPLRINLPAAPSLPDLEALDNTTTFDTGEKGSGRRIGTGPTILPISDDGLDFGEGFIQDGVFTAPTDGFYQISVSACYTFNENLSVFNNYWVGYSINRRVAVEQSNDATNTTLSNMIAHYSAPHRQHQESDGRYNHLLLDGTHHGKTWNLNRGVVDVCAQGESNPVKLSQGDQFVAKVRALASTDANGSVLKRARMTVLKQQLISPPRVVRDLPTLRIRSEDSDQVFKIRLREHIKSAVSNQVNFNISKEGDAVIVFKTSSDVLEIRPQKSGVTVVTVDASVSESTPSTTVQFLVEVLGGIEQPLTVLIKREDIKSTNAELVVETNKSTTLQVNFGQSENALDYSVRGESNTAHTITLPNLEPGKTYFYQVIATDVIGGTVSSNTRSFVTKEIEVVGVPITVGNVTGSPGSTISVPISITDAQGIAGATLTFGFDDDLLTPIKVDGSELLSSVNVTPNTNLDFAPGEVKINWAGFNSIASGNGNLVTVRFEIKPSVADGISSPLTLQADLRDENGNIIPSTSIAGLLTVGGKIGDVNNNDQVDSGDAVLILRYNLGLVTFDDAQKDRGDVNGDGSVDSGDAVLVLRHELGLIGKFPREGASKLVLSSVHQTEGVQFGEIRTHNELYDATEGYPTSVQEAEIVEIPLIFGQGVYGGDLTINYRSGLDGDVKIKHSGNAHVAYNINESGMIRVSMARSVANEPLVLTMIIPLDNGWITSENLPFYLLMHGKIFGENGWPLGTIENVSSGLQGVSLKVFPNPFNPDTMIHYGLSESGEVRLIVYNLLGQVVREIISEHQQSGWHTTSWDGRDNAGRVVSSGTYLIQLNTGEVSQMQKVMLLK